MFRKCWDKPKNYELDVLSLEEDSEVLPNNGLILGSKKQSKDKLCGSRLYKIIVMVLLITQMLTMITVGYFGSVFWKEINPMIAPIKRIVDKTNESLPTILNIINQTDHNLPVVIRIVNETDSTISFEYLGRIINETTLSLPQIIEIINTTDIYLPNMKIILDRSPEIAFIIKQMNASMPEIIRVINNLNSTLPHLESILAIIDNMQNLQQINNLIAEIPEIINVINFMNASIPEIEYIMSIFGHKTTTKHSLAFTMAPGIPPNCVSVNRTVCDNCCR